MSIRSYIRARASGIGRAFSALPLRWKILAPFVLLSLLYGASGTYVFARGTAAEAEANVSTRLRDVANLGLDALQRQEARLGDSVRLIANTEGVAEALARGDGDALRRLVVPPAFNAAHSATVVADRVGMALVEVRTDASGTPSLAAPGGKWEAPLIAGAVGEGTVQTGLLLQDGVWYVAVATPVVGERSGAPVGVAVTGDRLDGILRHLGKLTKSGISFVAPGGAVLAGPPVSARAPASSRTVQRPAGPAELLFVPVSIHQQDVGRLVIAVGRPSGLGALGGQAWRIAFLVVAVLAGVFLAGLWVSSRISRPLGELVQSARALQQGDLAHRVAVEGGDEVGELARSFNEMAAELQASHLELERRVEERTQELREALERLDRASQAKSSFLASMSHELRTPLSGIMLAAEILEEPPSPLARGRVRDLAARILRNGSHLVALIEDLLDLSRIEAGRVELNVKPVPVGELIADAETAIRPIAEKKGVTLEIHAMDDERVLADPLRVRQVLLNLLSNAVKFTPADGRVWVDVSSSRHTTAIAVGDTGIGIKRKDLERIFEPFEQASGQKQGLGLGLAISLKIAKLHGGGLEAASAPGKGSTFTLTLPVADGAGRGGRRA